MKCSKKGTPQLETANLSSGVTKDFFNDLVDVKGLAEKLGMSKQWIYELHESGVIPGMKPFGGKLFFSLTEVAEIIKSSRIPTKKELEREADNYLSARA